MKVELRDIQKRFGAVVANDRVSLTVEAGTIHGLLGENGAGKSTLMKVLSGFLAPDRGEVLLDGKAVRLDSPAQALARGVGMLHQDPLDFPSLSVLDNFLLGSGGWHLPRGRARDELAEWSRRFGFRLDPAASVGALSVGQRQQLELVRLLVRGARVLILDEPTTALTPHQKDLLFRALRDLAAEGRTVIFVSHRLAEVGELCSRATVLARGRVTGETGVPCPTGDLVRMMFAGRTVKLQETGVLRNPTPQAAETVLELDGVTIGDGRVTVRDLSLRVHSGEVIGLAGVEGSGQRLVLQTCAGLHRPWAGRVTFGPGRAPPEPAYAYVPAARLEEGLVAGMTVAEHVALREQAHRVWVDGAAAEKSTQRHLRDFAIRGDPSSEVQDLSGGNQQRVLLALLPERLRVLLLEHPTRGLDLESTEYVWGRLEERARQGTAILFSSSDLEELLARSDRLLVFCAGHVDELSARDVSLTEVGERMSGASGRAPDALCGHG
jgi:ABC-type uncharacterized transport system ATPase subunit